MIKKALYILLLPYLAIMLIESCVKQDYCVRRETRNITGVFFKHYITPYPNQPEQLILKMEYDSYFVSNFYVNILNKAMARKEEQPNPNACFEGFSNAISEIKINSSSDFNSSFTAGTELNSLFKENIYNDTINNLNFDWENLYITVPNSFIIYNYLKPSIDSIHDLYFEVILEDRTSYFDTLYNINLNQTYNPRR